MSVCRNGIFALRRGDTIDSMNANECEWKIRTVRSLCNVELHCIKLNTSFFFIHSFSKHRLNHHHHQQPHWFFPPKQFPWSVFTTVFEILFRIDDRSIRILIPENVKTKHSFSDCASYRKLCFLFVRSNRRMKHMYKYCKSLCHFMSGRLTMRLSC